MRIKLFENFHKGPELLNSFQDADDKLSDKDGIVLSGVAGDMTHVENAIKDIPHTEAYVLITDQRGHAASSWKSDVFLVGGTKEGEMSIKQYFDEEWIDPAGGIHRGDDEDPASMYESTPNNKELREKTDKILCDYVIHKDAKRLEQDIIKLFPNHPNLEMFKESLKEVIAEMQRGEKPLVAGSNSLYDWITDDDFD